MAKAVGLSQSAIVRVWHAFGLKPHLSESLQALDRPLLRREGPRRRRALHEPAGERDRPVGRREEPGAGVGPHPTAAADDPRPGRAGGRTDYVRNGTTSLFAALDVATGKVIGKCYKRHRQQEFLKFLKEVDARVVREPGVQIHIIMDNYGTHKTASVKRWFERHPEYHLHFTPTSGSWLNQVERFFAEITEKQIRRGVFPQRGGVGEGDHGVPGRA